MTHSPTVHLTLSGVALSRTGPGYVVAKERQEAGPYRAGVLVVEIEGYDEPVRAPVLVRWRGRYGKTRTGPGDGRAVSGGGTAFVPRRRGVP